MPGHADNRKAASRAPTTRPAARRRPSPELVALGETTLRKPLLFIREKIAAHMFYTAGSREFVFTNTIPGADTSKEELSEGVPELVAAGNGRNSFPHAAGCVGEGLSARAQAFSVVAGSGGRT